MAILKTRSFEFKLPEPWTIESLGPPATVIGPNGECAMVNSAVILGECEPEDYETVKRALEHNARDAMDNASQDRRLVVAQKLTRSETPNGKVFFEIHCRTKDGNQFFSEFSIGGPRNVVLVTIEGERGAMDSIEVLRDATANIKWLGTPKRPFWKFW